MRKEKERRGRVPRGHFHLARRPSRVINRRLEIIKSRQDHENDMTIHVHASLEMLNGKTKERKESRLGTHPRDPESGGAEARVCAIAQSNDPLG